MCDGICSVPRGKSGAKCFYIEFSPSATYTYTEVDIYEYHDNMNMFYLLLGMTQREKVHIKHDFPNGFCLSPSIM